MPADRHAPMSLDGILNAVRTHLGMDVAFISEFTDGRRVFRHVENAEDKKCIEVGASDPLEESYCHWIVRGKLPQLIRDPADHPFTASFAVTKSLPVGAHLSVPIRLRNGDIYGTFCCFSSQPDPSLTSRDLATMEAFAQLAGEQIQKAIDGDEARQTIEHPERGFELLVHAVTDYAIYMIDPTGRIVTWNMGAERNKGYTADEAIGQNFRMFYTGEDQAAGRPERALRIAETTGRYEEEGWRVRKDGSTMLAHVVIDPVRDDSGELIGFAKITRDITEKKNVERQLVQAQKMEAVGQLTGGIAHDFNNILSVVVANLDILIDDLDSSPEQKTVATEALNAAEKGAELVRQLLAFSRNQTLQVAQINIQELISRAEPLLRRALGESIRIEFGCDDAVWPVLADPTQVESAIVNVAINARDAMLGGGKLSIRCSNISLDEHLARQEDLQMGDYVLLKITDTGAGIEPDVLARVFDPFFTTKEVGKGTGLGLSMVYGFARQSGGAVKIYSEPGHGTEVRLYLPRANVEGETEAAKRSIVTVAGNHERVLIVEDREEVRKIAVRAATSLGYEVIEADSAEVALELVDGVHFDILFTDVVMPGKMNGLDLAWKLRKRFPTLAIVLTSGFSDPEVIATDLGALKATLLPKPYRKADLSQVLRRALGQ